MFVTSDRLILTCRSTSRWHQRCLRASVVSQHWCLQQVQYAATKLVPGL